MAETVVMHMVGAECAPEKEAEFNLWYSNRHAPMVLQGPVVSVERYRRMEPDAGWVGDDQRIYPTYLAVYEFAGEKALNEYFKSPLYQEVVKDIKEKWRGLGEFVQTWSISYRRIAKRGNGGGNPQIMHIDGTHPPDADEAKYNEWYTNDHMVYMLRNPYIVRAERFQRIENEAGYPKYLAVYRFESEQTLLESKTNFLTGKARGDRRRYWPDKIWKRPWLVRYKLISKERKDLVV